jgi:hypothetical protein
MNDVMFVARIHNNSLGACVPVNSYEEGEQLIRQWVKDYFGRDISEVENEDLVNTREFYSDDDIDNIITFTIGIVQ